MGEKEGAKKDSETMSLEEDFKAAANFVRSLPSDGPVKPDNDTKLKFYSFYKQATEGDVKGDRPGMFSFEAKAKWDAWNSVKGMDSEEAMANYIDALTSIAPNWKN